MKETLKTNTDNALITKRARQLVTKLVEDGVTDAHEIARLCDTTVASLLEGGAPTLRKPQFKALKTHFDVSLMWLWTGHGPQFLKEKDFTTA